MDVLYTTLIKPDHVLDITAENLAQFEILGDEIATVRSQLMIVAWNRGDSYILDKCDGDVEHPRFQKFIRSRGVNRVQLDWESGGVRAIIWDEEVENPWQKQGL